MKHRINIISSFLIVLGLTATIASCEKDPAATVSTPSTPTASASFTEEFTNVGDLSSKGWVFKNNSDPVGQAGWRQGRYESASSLQYKFLAPVPYIGFPAYSSSTSPNDFVSCDASCVNDALTGTGDISAWLITPPISVKNGDQIVFYTRAVDDTEYPAYCKDRMQVRANFTNGDAEVGNTATSTGSFSRLLLDINPNYIYNDPGGNSGGVAGYPRGWAKATITISGLTAPVSNARFAFRYLGTDAGVYGGSNNDNYPTVVGVDAFSFISK